MGVFLTFLNKSFPYGWPWGISRDAPPPPPESVRTFARSLARSVVRWRRNQIFSAWWVTNVSYPWCFASALRALKLRYDDNPHEMFLLVIRANDGGWHPLVGLKGRHMTKHHLAEWSTWIWKFSYEVREIVANNILSGRTNIPPLACQHAVAMAN